MSHTRRCEIDKINQELAQAGKPYELQHYDGGDPMKTLGGPTMLEWLKPMLDGNPDHQRRCHFM